VFDGGALKYIGSTASTDRSFTINSLKSAVIDVSEAATELTMSGNSGASTGGLTKQGFGTLILTGTHAYSGDTLVSGGTLRLGVGGSLSSATKITVSTGATFDSGATPLGIAAGQEFKVNGGITGNLDISDGGILSGSGSITGDVTFADGGIHAVGNSPGLQEITGDVSYNAGSSFYWDLMVPTDPSANFLAEIQSGYGTEWDAVDITGNLLGEAGAIFRVVLDTDDFSNDFWLTGRRWNSVFNADNINLVDLNNIFTTFEFYSGGSLIAAPSEGSFSFQNGDLVFAIPEPSSSLLVALLLGTALLRRSRDEPVIVAVTE
jgi:autotransporter-associated beta strand protein